MKKIIIITAAMFLTFGIGYSQSSRAIVSGGWSTMHPKDTDKNYDGFKIGVLGENIMSNGMLSVGGSISYLGGYNFETDSMAFNTTTKYHSLPINLQGKFLVGKNKIQGYIKGIAGIHFATLIVESPNADVKYKEAGWSYGYGAGIILHLSETTLLNFDWEADYLASSNADIFTAITNSFSIGIGKSL